jgi:hypothetical protein
VTKRVRGVLCALTTVALLAASLSACTGGGSGGKKQQSAGRPSSQQVAGAVPDRAALDRAGARLPKDPVDAAEQLVAVAFGADFPKAVAAVGNLLLRVGLPLVSAAGPVVALPAGPVITNVPIDVEMLPTLTDALRSDVIFTPDQVATMLQVAGGMDQPLTGPQVVGILAEWGKRDGAPSEVVSAGATVRATAAARHQLLTPGTVADAATLTNVAEHPDKVDAQTLGRVLASGGTVDLDPLQVVLLAAHAGSDVAAGVQVGHGAPAHPSPPASGHSFLGTATGSVCDYLDTSKPAGKEDGDLGKSIGKKVFRDWLKDAAQDRWGGKTGDNLGKAFKRLDQGLDLVTIILLQLGAKLEVTADKQTTHFRHEAGDSSRNVSFTARASFSSALAKQHLACWALAGISVPPDGPLAGYRVRWMLRAEPQVLRVEPADEDMITDGAKTDSDGRTPSVETYPRTESNPPAKNADVPEQTVVETMAASLDKDDFAIHLKDLFNIGTKVRNVSKILDAPMYLAYQMAVSLAKRAVLPVAKLKIPVTYHGQNPYVISGNGQFDAIFLAKVGMTADFYSCNSVAGPWHGTASLTGLSDGTIEIIAGGTAKEHSGTTKYSATFTLDRHSAKSQHVDINPKFGLVIELDPDAIDQLENSTSIADQYDRLSDRQVVGDGSWVIGGTDVRKVTGFLSPSLSDGITFHVVAVQRDPRCPGGSIWDDPFDAG